jgi:protein AbiQ
MDNAEKIQKKADKIYEMVTTNRKQILTDNSCAFHILEAGYREYIEKHLTLEKAKEVVPHAGTGEAAGG